jgi:cystathionine gamma-synthase
MMGRDAFTIAASSGIGALPVSGDVAPPLHVSDTYVWTSPDEKPAFDYSRTVNPNRQLLLDALCELEGATGGAITSSGQSAALLALFILPPKARIVAPHDCYGGTWRLLDGWARQTGACVTFVDQRDGARFQEALMSGVDLLWLESPSNPLLRLVDIKSRAAAAKRLGAIVLADNTVPTPCTQQPIALGVDLVLHSTTKAINGHHDLFGGALLSANAEFAERIEWWCNAAGLAASAFDSWQALRGLRTLPLRVERQQQSAATIAQFLEGLSNVAKVHYPGLPSHPDCSLVREQCSGPGFLLSFEIKGDAERLKRFLKRLRLVKLASSLGGFSSLICIPSTMTHRGMPPEAQRAAGITPGLLRLSVGLEDPEAIIDDLARALADA